MGFSFMIMFLVLQGQRVEVCITVQCRVFKSTAVSQLISEDDENVTPTESLSALGENLVRHG